MLTSDNEYAYKQVIAHLEAEVKRLHAELTKAQAQAQANWDALETVSCGEGLTCEDCKKSRPCTCHDTGS